MSLSARNSQVARLRSLARDRGARSEAGRFVVEGTKLVTEALQSNLDVWGIWFDDQATLDSRLVALASSDHVDLQPVVARGIERIASTSSPQPVVAEVEMPPVGWENLTRPTAVLVGVNINDPGNVGTLMRSALAAGFDAFIALGDCADPFGPKAVRASAGACLRLDVVVERDISVGIGQVRNHELALVGTRMSEATRCDETDLVAPVAIVFGSEAHGIGDDVASSIDMWVTIPMSGRVESLNVAMAATVLTYETARQRRNAEPHAALL